MVQSTRLFLDGGDPAETAQIDAMLRAGGQPGLDGQTTNPSLIAKNLGKTLTEGKKLTAVEADAEYKRIVTEMAKTLTGPISIQVIADPTTPAATMLAMARERASWIPNSVIKFPCIPPGLEAASEFSKEGNVNMTLVFSQEQAAAVYAATTGHAKEVFVSPFVGRLDDKGQYGMSLIANILKMYNSGDHHVAVLTASVRSLEQFKQAIFLKSDIITAPGSVYTAWKDAGFPVPDENFFYDKQNLTDIPYGEIDLTKLYGEYDLHHDLTDAGLTKFLADWHQWVE